MKNTNINPKVERLLLAAKAVLSLLEGEYLDESFGGETDQLRDAIQEWDSPCEEECGDDCLSHDPECDGYCDHSVDHINACIDPDDRQDIADAIGLAYLFGHTKV